MSLEPVLKEAMDKVAGCVAVGVVHLRNGMLLGQVTQNKQPTTVMQLLAGATGEMFEGPTTKRVQEAFRAANGKPEESYLWETIVGRTKRTIHCMYRAPSRPDVVVVFVCHANAGMGLAIATSEGALPAVMEAVPKL